MQADTLERIQQQLIELPSDKLELVLNFVSNLSFLQQEAKEVPAQNYDITKTKTWAAIGLYQIPNPESQYIVSTDSSQELITNYAEHVDETLYPPVNLI
jgi:hypothetical protein